MKHFLRVTSDMRLIFYHPFHISSEAGQKDPQHSQPVAGCSTSAAALQRDDGSTPDVIRVSMPTLDISSEEESPAKMSVVRTVATSGQRKLDGFLIYLG
jgi:hypothetical protein